MRFRLLLGGYIFLSQFILVAFTDKACCQSYGLGFSGHEVVQDKRTGLDLSPGKTICLRNDFELVFDLEFIPGRNDYFGYIVRLIGEGDQNIDVLYDLRSTDDLHFKVIIGESFSDIAFNIEQETLFYKWSRLRLKVYPSKKILEFFVNNRKFIQPLKAAPGKCYKILFGANDYQDFKTTDVPPMKIRDVRIFDSGRLAYNWLLDDDSGTLAAERVKGARAFVVNPLWVKRLHYNWQLVSTFVAGGSASVAFNPQSEEVYIVGEDSLISYSVGSSVKSYRYRSGKLDLVNGNQSLYSPATHTLYNIYQDQHLISVYNFETQTWSRQYDTPADETVYGHMNKFFSDVDSAIYTIGGYGQFLYKNSLRRYSVSTGKWDSVIAKGDAFTPRYLAACGAVKDGFYILGGYGSSTGQQMLNPRNLYDLMYYDVKKQSFRKICELNIEGEDFVLANSMITDEPGDFYYALTFSKNKYNSNLRLIKGSLHKPEFKFLGGKIPYAFQDRYSFADLYYCPKSKRLIAVTLLRGENNQTKVNIFCLNSPPVGYKESNLAGAGLRWWYVGGVAVTVILIVWLILNRRRKSKAKRPDDTGKHVKDPQKEVREAPAYEDAAVTDGTPLTRNSIFLFGDFQVFDAEGNDLTKHFTPLIKELFLVLLLYTISKGRGISSEKLYELLWFDKSIDSARNNRSVNMVKLKSILDKMAVCKISKETGYWKIDIDYRKIWVDYKGYVDIVRDKKRLDKQKISDLALIIKRGAFLSGLEYSWLDEFKSDISNEVIDTYLHFAGSVKVSEDPEFMIELANYIFYFDSVNEEAMTIKCKALAYLGKHSLARNSFENFAKEYKHLYGENFDHDFNEVLNK